MRSRKLSFFDHGDRRRVSPRLISSPNAKISLNLAERSYLDELLSKDGVTRPRAKACYRSAQQLILADDKGRLRYWEGLLDNSIPHAWVTINGKVVDLTSEAVARKLKRLGISTKQREERVYSGICIDRRRVLRHILKTNEYSPVVDSNSWS